MKNPILKILKKSPNIEKTEIQIFLNEDPAYSKYQIGRFTYGKPKIISWNQETNLSIGSFCSIAGNVQILLGGEHRTDWITTYPFSELIPEAKNFKGHPASKGDIIIGSDVWIGQNTIILSGVTIGNGAVIGAGSVVTSDIPAYAVAAGNPARKIRFRFSPDEISKLEVIAWWDWPVQNIIDALPYLLSNQLNEFLELYSPS